MACVGFSLASHSTLGFIVRMTRHPSLQVSSQAWSSEYLQAFMAWASIVLVGRPRTSPLVATALKSQVGSGRWGAVATAEAFSGNGGSAGIGIQCVASVLYLSPSVARNIQAFASCDHRQFVNRVRALAQSMVSSLGADSIGIHEDGEQAAASNGPAAFSFAGSLPMISERRLHIHLY